MKGGLSLLVRACVATARHARVALYASHPHHAIITLKHSNVQGTEGYRGMATQQQVQQPHQPQQNKSHLRRRLIIAVVIVALIVSTVWILSSLAIIQGIWATIVSTLVTVFGVVFTFLPLITSADKSEPPPTPQINVQVQLPPLAPQLPMPTSPTASSYRGIIGLPPPTDPRTIQQREKVVKEVYRQLIQPGITAI